MKKEELYYIISFVQYAFILVYTLNSKENVCRSMRKIRILKRMQAIDVKYIRKNIIIILHYNRNIEKEKRSTLCFVEFLYFSFLFLFSSSFFLVFIVLLCVFLFSFFAFIIFLLFFFYYYYLKSLFIFLCIFFVCSLYSFRCVSVAISPHVHLLLKCTSITLQLVLVVYV